MNAKTRIKLEEVFRKTELLERSIEKLISHINFYGSDITEREGKEIEKAMSVFKASGFPEVLDYLKETFLEE